MARYEHTATLLQNGKVLFVGGRGTNGGALALAELYDPATGVCTPAGPLTFAREAHTATLLPNGRVLPVWKFPPGWALAAVFVNGIPSIIN